MSCGEWKVVEGLGSVGDYEAVTVGRRPEVLAVMGRVGRLWNFPGLRRFLGRGGSPGG
jgi:hypothetical protein